VLDDPKVSCRHADIRWERGRFVLYDLQSTAGTFVNGRRIQRHPLRPFDQIRMGRTTLFFVPGRRVRALQDGHRPALRPLTAAAAGGAVPALPGSATSAVQRWCLVGSSTRDVYIGVDALKSTASQVAFRNGFGLCLVPLAEGPAFWGRKCLAQVDLSSHAGLGKIELGGGIWNSTMQLAACITAQSLSIVLVPIDDRACWAEIDAGYRRLGACAVFLGAQAAPTNLVLTNGTPDRIILKSPAPPVATPPILDEAALGAALHQAQVLLINSPKDGRLARLASNVALAHGVAQYSVLSTSLPIADRVETLLARDAASVCNLAEFQQLAAQLGYSCPSDETDADLVAVASAMARVAGLHAAGDLVVTLGARGCLAADRAAGAVAHIALRPARAVQVQRFVSTCAERRNGIGDRFFGSFVFTHALDDAAAPLLRAWRTALAASIDMVRYLVPNSRPGSHWFVVRPLPVRF
jgi:hypothetical protein